MTPSAIIQPDFERKGSSSEAVRRAEASDVVAMVSSFHCGCFLLKQAIPEPPGWFRGIGIMRSAGSGQDLIARPIWIIAARTTVVTPRAIHPRRSPIIYSIAFLWRYSL